MRTQRTQRTRSNFFLKALLLGLATVGCSSGFVGEVACGRSPQASTSSIGSQLAQSIVDPYLKIQTALAQDRMDDVKANAGNIATAASSLGAPAVKIDTAAVQLASATELADARSKFGALSDAVVAYMDNQHLKAPDGVRKAYCPMAQKPWLQRGDTLENPYYGQSMPTCGEFK
jgi:membrane fusion protein, copper/silver efflux system